MQHNRHVSDHAGTGLPDPQFPKATWGREGYVAAEVDEFVGRLRGSLHRDRPTMAPYEIVDQRFKVTRIGRRYGLRAVDEYLDAGQAALAERNSFAPITAHAGRAEPRHSTWWIYLVALVLVAMMLLFLVTQL